MSKQKKWTIVLLLTILGSIIGTFSSLHGAAYDVSVHLADILLGVHVFANPIAFFISLLVFPYGNVAGGAVIGAVPYFIIGLIVTAKSKKKIFIPLYLLLHMLALAYNIIFLIGASS